MKHLIHVICPMDVNKESNLVSRRTLVCEGCNQRVKNPNEYKLVRGEYVKPRIYNRSRSSMNFELMVGPDRRRSDMSFRYPRQ